MRAGLPEGATSARGAFSTLPCVLLHLPWKPRYRSKASLVCLSACVVVVVVVVVGVVGVIGVGYKAVVIVVEVEVTVVVISAHGLPGVLDGL